MNLLLSMVLGGVGGLIISLASLLLLFYFIKTKLMDAISVRLKEEFANNPGQSEGLIEDSLDHLMDAMRAQIPMGNMLLGGSLAQKLKLKLKTEFLVMLPSLIPRLLLQVRGSLQDEVKRNFDSYFVPVGALGVCLGIALGFLFFALK